VPWAGPLFRPATAGGEVGPQQLVGPAVTLVLGWIVALAMYFSASDVPDSYLGDRVVPFAMLLVALAVPVALLVAWGEVDLSAFGMLPLAAWIYTEVGESGVLVGLVVAAVACGAVGLCIGLVRWATRAPSALVSLAAALVLQAVAFKQLGTQGNALIEEGFIEGSDLPVLAGLAFTAVTLLVALTLKRPAEAAADAPPWGPGVVVGFGLSGAAAGVYGATSTGITGAALAADGSNILLVLFCAVAIGGVVRGNRLVGPIAAAFGALATQVLVDAGVIRGWEPFDTRLLTGIVLAACLLIAHGLHRALAPR
jgi:ribose/xylose/arabinose/galactoside ABC-type transport system permease subunit